MKKEMMRRRRKNKNPFFILIILGLRFVGASTIRDGGNQMVPAGMNKKKN